MGKLTLGEFRKMTESLPDDTVIGFTKHHRGGPDNWNCYQDSFDTFNGLSNESVIMNFGKNELSIGTVDL